MLNDKTIKPDLFSEENTDDKNTKDNNENIENNNKDEKINDKIIIEQNKLDENVCYQNEIELPDSSIESEIHNYDVSNILFNILI